MKKLIVFVLCLIFCATALASFTNSADNARATFRNSYAWSGNSPRDKATLWAQEVEAKLEGETAIFSKLTVTIASGTATTLTAGQSGSVILVTGLPAATHTVTLPPAAAGLHYTIIDNKSTAAADVTLTPASGDSIGNNDAVTSPTITSREDVGGPTIHLVAVDTASWIIVSASRIWSP